MILTRDARRREVRLPPTPRRIDELDWAASGWAGLTGAAVFLALELLVWPSLAGYSPGAAARRIAAIALGQTALPQRFSALLVLAVVGVHLTLSLIYARGIALLVRARDPARAAGVGALVGVALYALNYYLLSGLFPWFAAARSPAALASHVAFGTSTAWTYARLRTKADDGERRIRPS